MADKKVEEKVVVPVTPQTPEMVEAEFNHEKILLPKDVVDKVKNYETFLRSDLQTKHQTAMQEAKTYRENVAEWEEADIKWYSEHPKEAWVHYVPLVRNEGQGGYKGDPALLVAKPDDDGEDIYTKPDAKPNSNVMQPNTTLSDVQELKKQFSDLEIKMEQRVADETKGALGRLSSDPKYNMAKYDEVFTKVVNHYRDTGTHATAETMKVFLQNSHDSTLKLIKSRGDFVEKPRSEGLPPLGSLPREPIKNLPKLKETSKVARLATDFLLGRG